MRKTTQCCTQILLPVVRILLIVLLATSCHLFRRNNTQHGGKPPQSSGASAPQPQDSKIDTTEKMAKAKDIVDIVTELMAPNSWTLAYNNLLPELQEAGRSISLYDTKRILQVFNKYADAYRGASENIRTICTTLVNTDSAFVDTLCQASKDKDTTLRQAAVRALGDCYPSISDAAKRGKALNIVIQAAQGTDNTVRQAAVETLGKIQGLDQEASTKVVDTLLSVVQDEDTTVGQAAVRALGECYPSISDAAKRAKVLNIVIQAAKDTTRTDRQTAAVKALGNIQDLDDAAHDKVVDALQQAIKDKDWNVRWEAVNTLEQLRAAIKPASSSEILLQALQDIHFDIRRKAGIALGNLASTDLAFFSTLLTKINTTHVSTRRGSFLITEVYFLVNNNFGHQVGQKLDLQGISQALEKLDPTKPASLAVLLQAKAHTAQQFQKIAQDKINKNSNTSSPQHADFVKTLCTIFVDNTKEVDIRRAALQQLRQIFITEETPDSTNLDRFLEALFKASKDAEKVVEIRLAAIRTLGNLNKGERLSIEKQQESLACLCDAVSTPNVRKAVVQALGEQLEAIDQKVLDGSKDLSKKVLSVLFQASKDVNQHGLSDAAEQTLRKLHIINEQALDFLFKTSEGPDPKVCQAAVQVLGNLQNIERYSIANQQKILGCLCAAAQQGKPSNVRKEAVYALQKQLHAIAIGNQAVAVLSQNQNQDQNLLAKALEALSQATSNGTDPQVYEAAVKTFHKLQKTSEEAPSILPQDFGQQACNVALTAIAHADERVCAAAVYLLVALIKNLSEYSNEEQQKILTALYASAEAHNKDYVGGAAAQGLVVFYNHKQARLTDFLDPTKSWESSEVVAFLQDQSLTNSEVIDRALRILTYYGRNDEECRTAGHQLKNAKTQLLTHLRTMIGSEQDDEIYQAAVKALGNLCGRDSTYLADLCAAIKDKKSNDVRQAAFGALQTFYTRERQYFSEVLKKYVAGNGAPDTIIKVLNELNIRVEHIYTSLRVLRAATKANEDQDVQASNAYHQLENIKTELLAFVFKMIAQGQGEQVCRAAVEALNAFYTEESQDFSEVLNTSAGNCGSDTVITALGALQTVINQESLQTLCTAATQNTGYLARSAVVHLLWKFYTKTRQLSSEARSKHDQNGDSGAKVVNALQEFETVTKANSLQALWNAITEETAPECCKAAAEALNLVLDKVLEVCSEHNQDSDNGDTVVNTLEAFEAVTNANFLEALHNAATGNTGPEVGEAAVWALDRLYTKTRQLCSEVRSRYNQNDASVFEVLTKLDTVLNTSLDTLCEAATKHTDEKVRLEAVATLNRILNFNKNAPNQVVQSALQAVIQAVQDQQEAVRLKALTVLRTAFIKFEADQLGENAPKAVIQAVQDQQAAVRLKALTVLRTAFIKFEATQLGESEFRAVIQAVQDQQEEVRLEALTALEIAFPKFDFNQQLDQDALIAVMKGVQNVAWAVYNKAVAILEAASKEFQTLPCNHLDGKVLKIVMQDVKDIEGPRAPRPLAILKIILNIFCSHGTIDAHAVAAVIEGITCQKEHVRTLTVEALKQANLQNLSKVVEALRPDVLKQGSYDSWHTIHSLKKLYTIKDLALVLNDSQEKMAKDEVLIDKALKSQELKRLMTIYTSLRVLYRIHKTSDQADVRKCAQSIHKEFQDTAKKLVKFFKKIITQESTPGVSSSTRCKAIQVIAESKISSQRLLSSLCEVIASKQQSLEVRKAAIEALGAYAIDEQLLNDFTAYNNETDASTTLNLLDRLVLKLPGAIDGSLEVLQQITKGQSKDNSAQKAVQEDQSEEEPIRQAATNALQTLTVTKETLLKFLYDVINHENDQNWEVRVAAINVLGKLSAQLGAAKCDKSLTILQNIIKNTKTNNKCYLAAIEAYKKFVLITRTRLKACCQGMLIAQKRIKNLPSVIQKQIDALPVIQGQIESFSKVLYQVIQNTDQSQEVRVAAINALEELGAKDLASVNVLLQIVASENDDMTVREAAIEVLQKFFTMDKTVFSKLQREYNAAKYGLVVKFLANKGLETINQALEVLESATKSKKSNLTAKAKNALESLTNTRKQVLARLKKVAEIKSKDWLACLQAINALGRFNSIDDTLLQTLGEAIKCQEPGSQAAVQALGDLGAYITKAALKVLLDLVSNTEADEALRLAAIRALGNLGTAINEAALKVLLDLVSNTEADEALRLAAIRALGNLGTAINEAALKVLLDLAPKTEENQDLCLAAINALGNLGTAINEAALKVLFDLAAKTKAKQALRIAAINALKKLSASINAKTVDFWSQLASNAQATEALRLAAIEALGKLGADINEEALQVLLNRAANTEATKALRLAAIKALGKLGTFIGSESLSSVVQALKQAAQEDDDRVCLVAIEALGKPGSAISEEALKVLYDLAANTEANQDLRIAAIEALGKLGADITEETLKVLYDLAANTEANQDLRIAAIKALGKLGTNINEEALQVLLPLVSNTEATEALRLAAIEALGKLGANINGEALQVLLPLVSNTEATEALRIAAIEALGKLGANINEEALQVLLPLASKTKANQDLRIAVIAALGKLGASIDPECLSSSVVQTLQQAVQDDDDSVCLEAIEALGKLGANINEEALKVLCDLVSNEDTDQALRQAGSKALKKLSASINEHTINFWSKLASKTEVTKALRLAAIEALGKLGASISSEALKVLCNLAAKKEVNQDLRLAAIEALGKLGASIDPECLSSSVVQTLQRAAQDDDDSVCLEAIEALGKLGSNISEEALKVLCDLAAKTEANQALRLAAIEALGELGTAINEAALEGLLALASKTKANQALRLAAIKALGNLGTAITAAALEGLLALASKTKANQALRLAAIEALGELGTAINEAALEGLLDFAKNETNETLRKEPVKALNKLSASINEHTINFWSKLASSKEEDQALRLAAIAALGKLGASIGSEALSLALAALQQAAKDEDSSVKQAAEEALSEFEASHPALSMPQVSEGQDLLTSQKAASSQQQASG